MPFRVIKKTVIMKRTVKSKFKAVLFDMDGILIDSMPYHFISWFEALRQYDIRVTPMDIFAMEGAKWDKVIRFAFKRDKKKLQADLIEKICAQRNVLMKKYFKRYVFAQIPMILGILKKRGFLTAIVTGSSLKEAEKMLPANIYSMFDIAVAGDMIKRSKPYPDPYLLAARKLGVKTCECLAVENAPYGIKSAKSAKMFCVAVATSLPEQYLKEASIIFKNHTELYKYIKNL